MQGSPWRLSIMYKRNLSPSRCRSSPACLAHPLGLHCRPVAPAWPLFDALKSLPALQH